MPKFNAYGPDNFIDRKAPGQRPRRNAVYVLLLSQGVRWSERWLGQAAEGVEERKRLLCKAVLDLTPEKLILKEAASGCLGGLRPTW